MRQASSESSLDALSFQSIWSSSMLCCATPDLCTGPFWQFLWCSVSLVLRSSFSNICQKEHLHERRNQLTDSLQSTTAPDNLNRVTELIEQYASRLYKRRVKEALYIQKFQSGPGSQSGTVLYTNHLQFPGISIFSLIFSFFFFSFLSPFLTAACNSLHNFR